MTATVARIENYGAFLQLEDGRMGLVHISEIDRNYVKDVREHLREGDTVEAKVVAIKDDGKIDLSIKALQDPPPPRAPRRGSDPEFEQMMKKFMKQSEERQVDFRRATELNRESRELGLRCADAGVEFLARDQELNLGLRLREHFVSQVTTSEENAHHVLEEDQSGGPLREKSVLRRIEAVQVTIEAQRRNAPGHSNIRPDAVDRLGRVLHHLRVDPIAVRARLVRDVGEHHRLAGLELDAPRE